MTRNYFYTTIERTQSAILPQLQDSSLATYAWLMITAALELDKKTTAPKANRD